MKAWTLLFLRATTGLLLVVWGTLRLVATEAGIGVAETYYSGMGGTAAVQIAIGAVQVVLGLLVVLGLFRRIVYPAQAVWLGLGAAFVWRSILDPLGIVFGEDAVNILFFPSSTVFVATLVLIAFREYDALSLDAKRGAASPARSGA